MNRPEKITDNDEPGGGNAAVDDGLGETQQLHLLEQSDTPQPLPSDIVMESSSDQFAQHRDPSESGDHDALLLNVPPWIKELTSTLCRASMIHVHQSKPESHSGQP
eukprot:m.339857 g.339857  ORF g.339857 m.339857 type:complete len:106 (-) comp16097_c0_seq4:179-496(-)